MFVWTFAKLKTYPLGLVSARNGLGITLMQNLIAFLCMKVDDNAAISHYQ